MLDDIKVYLVMAGVFVAAGLSKGIGRGGLPLLTGFTVRATRDSYGRADETTPSDLRLARKQQIFEEMQKAKIEGRPYALPDDWND